MDVWGDEFEAMYTRLEQEGKGRKTVKASGSGFRVSGLKIYIGFRVSGLKI